MSAKCWWSNWAESLLLGEGSSVLLEDGNSVGVGRLEVSLDSLHVTLIRPARMSEVFHNHRGESRTNLEVGHVTLLVELGQLESEGVDNVLFHKDEDARVSQPTLEQAR